jgi:hypothetical protein
MRPCACGQHGVVHLRIVLGQVQAAVGRQAFEQDFAEVFAAGSPRERYREVGHQFSSSLRMRVMGASTVGSACSSASMAAFMVPSRVSCVRMIRSSTAPQRVATAFAAHLVGLALQHRVDADAGTGHDAGHLGQHAGLVGHAQAQVVAGDHLAHGQHGQVVMAGQRVRLEGQVRHAVERVGRVQAGDVHQIGNHGAGGGLEPAPLP